MVKQGSNPIRCILESLLAAAGWRGQEAEGLKVESQVRANKGPSQGQENGV